MAVNKNPLSVFGPRDLFYTIEFVYNWKILTDLFLHKNCGCAQKKRHRQKTVPLSK